MDLILDTGVLFESFRLEFFLRFNCLFTGNKKRANFHIDTLYPALIKKADEILDKMGIPPKVFNNKWKC